MRRPLAATLMVSIIVLQAGDGSYGAVPADEIDGDEVQVLVEIDPWADRRRNIADPLKATISPEELRLLQRQDERRRLLSSITLLSRA